MNEQQFGYNTQLAQQQFNYNSALQEDSQAFNASESQKSRDWQSQMASQSQDWTQQNMNLSSDLEYQNWEKAFNAQNAYNDPSAQRARLETAGYNPQLANGTVNTLSGNGMSSSASASAPSVGSGAAASSSPAGVGLASVGNGSAPMYDESQSLANVLGSITGVADAAIKYNLSRSEVHQLNSQARKNTADSVWQELLTKLMNSPYVNENNENVMTTDDNGQPRPMSNGEAQQRGLSNKIINEAAKTGKDADAQDIVNAINSLMLDARVQSQPDLIAALKLADDKLSKELEVNDASIRYYDSVAGLNTELSESERFFRPLKGNLLASQTSLNQANISSIMQSVEQLGYRWKERVGAAIDVAEHQSVITGSQAKQMKDELDFISDYDGVNGFFNKHLRQAGWQAKALGSIFVGLLSSGR